MHQLRIQIVLAQICKRMCACTERMLMSKTVAQPQLARSAVLRMALPEL